MVAAKLGDPKVAAALLAPFTLSEVTANAASRVADLLDRYGTEFSRALLQQWASERKVYLAPETQTAWIGSTLPGLCRSLCARDSSDQASGLHHPRCHISGHAGTLLAPPIECGQSSAVPAKLISMRSRR